MRGQRGPACRQFTPDAPHLPDPGLHLPLRTIFPCAQMFSKGLSSLGQLAGSAAHVAKEKAQQAHLDQTAAVSVCCTPLLCAVLGYTPIGCCLRCRGAAGNPGAAGNRPGQAAAVRGSVLTTLLAVVLGLMHLQAAAEKAKEMGSKGWSFLKSAYASAAAAVEQTAAQVRPGRARWAGGWAAGCLRVGAGWMGSSPLSPPHPWLPALPQRCRMDTRLTLAAARWQPRCTPPPPPAQWVLTTAATAAAPPLATRQLGRATMASGAAATVAVAARTSSLPLATSGGLAGMMPRVAARHVAALAAGSSMRRRMRSGAVGTRAAPPPRTLCLPMARPLMRTTGASGRQLAAECVCVRGRPGGRAALP